MPAIEAPKPLRRDDRALFEHDLPLPASSSAHHRTALVIVELGVLERARALPVVNHRSGVGRDRLDDDLGARAVVNLVPRGTENSEDGFAIEYLTVRRNVNVLAAHEFLDGGDVFFDPGSVPVVVELLEGCGGRRFVGRARRSVSPQGWLGGGWIRAGCQACH
jgi:hypothetical protein